MTTRLSDRHAEVDRRYIQMEHHRATLTAAQDAAEQAARACKNNYDTTTDMCEQFGQIPAPAGDTFREIRTRFVFEVHPRAGGGHNMWNLWTAPGVPVPSQIRNGCVFDRSTRSRRAFGQRVRRQFRQVSHFQVVAPRGRRVSVRRNARRAAA